MKKILLLAIAVVITAACMLFYRSLHNKNEKRYAKREFKGKSFDAGATGMIEYFYKLMSDPATGKIDLAAYYRAMSQATSLASNRATGNNLGLAWNFIGPDNIGGRTRAILFDKNNPNTVFAAGVSGGLWISGDGGQSWWIWSGSSQLNNMNIVSICQDDSGYIYFSTGEGCAGTLLSGYGNLGGTFPGYGVWKSTTPTNPANTTINFAHLSSTTPGSSAAPDTLDPTANWSETNRLAANPHAPDSIIAATVSTGGLMVSGNGGKSWVQAKGTPVLKGMGTDVKYSIDGKKVFAAINTGSLLPYGTSASLYYSTNGGASFTKISGIDGFPDKDESGGTIARIEIGVSPTNPNYAYAALVNSTGTNAGSLAYVVKTSDGGASWTTIGTGSGNNGYYNNNGFDPCTAQGTYDLVVAVSPVDTNTIFVGGTVLYRWTPTEGWNQIAYYGEDELYNELHADLHALVFDPANSSRLLVGCDGGIAQTLNPYYTGASGVQFTSLNRNYNVTQFYSAWADSEGRTIGGTQDNSVENIDFLGNTDLSATQILGGDGGSVEIASNNTAYFGTVPSDGAGPPGLYRSGSSGASFSTFFDAYSDSIIGLVGTQFILPFNLWEDTDSLAIRNSLGLQPKESLMAMGANSGEVWVTPSALNFGTSPTWFELQKLSGNVTALKFSPDGQYLYVGTDAGNIYRYSGFDSVFKTNGWGYPTVGTEIIYQWNATDSGIALVQSSYTGFSGRVIASISVNPNNYNEIVVTAANFSSTYTTSIVTSTDATTGFDFTSAQGSGATALPLGPVYSSCILHSEDGVPSGTILAGTWCGVWSSQDFGQTWQFENDTIGNVPIFAIEELPYYGSRAIYIGSYGRGLWSSQTFTTGINTIKTPSTINNLNVFPNPLSNTGYIQYNLAKGGNTIINLYDITGNLVKNIANENMIPGSNNIQFNVAGLANGTYIIDVIQGQNQATAKLIVLH